MANQIFIAREKQLDQLNACLQRALAGQGNVCFVSGEAGSGKTTLVTEFTRRALDQNQDLAVAVGQCDAETGAGDAHLPFREIMAQLTGDVESKLAQGAITKENASRLRKLLVLSGQALVDVGPDLIGIFVPGIGLATRIGGFVAEKAGWLDKLEKLVNKPKAEPGDSGLKESHIFEQFANVLCQLSQKHPLVLVLDDLHWADEASISLLFHLGRRINEHKILLLGTYRSAEVAIGRAGERHPLEKVLAEFKRYFGDITVDLDQAVKQEGYEFVTAFLASEPHALRADFATSLYHHTGGHPLFTVELLRNLQERGDLVQDEQGRWIESGSLDWESLPKRVEGVIQERIGRLQKELRQILTVGSVQGEDFTAEVIASVQQAEARDLVRRLGSELERQHKLVLSQGIQRLDLSGQRLSRFRFQHNLFRTYLYNELNESERTYLHEDVGNALETLYGDQADEVAVQLSLHFEIAGLNEKARHYLQEAGKQAAIRYANDEATDYFSRSLALTAENNLEQRYDLLLLREKVYSLQGAREKQVEDLTQLEKLADILNDEHKKVQVALRQTANYLDTSKFSDAAASAQKAINLAIAIHDENLLARSYLFLGISKGRTDNFDESVEYLNKALAISEESNIDHVKQMSLNNLGIISLLKGDFEEGKAYLEKSLPISKKIGDRQGQGKTLNNIGALYHFQGNFEKAKEYWMEGVEIFNEIGDLRNEGLIIGNIGGIFYEQRDSDQAISYYEQSLKIGQQLEDQDGQSSALKNLGEVAVHTGNLKSAEDYTAQALNLERGMGRGYQEGHALYRLGKIFLKQGKFTEALDYIEQSLKIYRDCEKPGSEASSLIWLGALHDYIGDYQGAKSLYEDALRIKDEMDDNPGKVLGLIHQGLLFHHIGQNEQAKGCCLNAIDLLNEIKDQVDEANAHLVLGHALSGLGDFKHAQEAYQQSIEIRQEMRQPFMATEGEAGLARIAMQQDHLDEAMKYITHLLDFLKDHSLDGTREPVRIYLACYQVLKANHDPRAVNILNIAHAFLMQRVEHIKDAQHRKSFLENVTANHEILNAFLITI